MAKSSKPKVKEVVFHVTEKPPVPMLLEKIFTKDKVKYGQCKLLTDKGLEQVDKNGEPIRKVYKYDHLTNKSPLSGALGIDMF
ncbi:MAG: hypothetical protein K0S32_2481 [Bacteroidetes bacterium]|jgi:hypothetical protein|nr:hypothetical protein [Bacteroidota bacterium]